MIMVSLFYCKCINKRIKTKIEKVNIGEQCFTRDKLNNGKKGCIEDYHAFS